MARVNNTNYGGVPATDFDYATDDNDAFDRDDISKVAQALDTHDHSAGKGLSVSRVADGSIVESKLGTGAVGTTKIADLAVTNDKLAASSVTADKIATDAVGADEIVALGVGTAELANSAVTTAKINDDAVTVDKIGPLAVGTTEIAALSVTNPKLAAGVAVANLGFTPINKGDDTGVGNIGLAVDKVIRMVGAGAEHTWVLKVDAGSVFLYDESANIPQLRLQDGNAVPSVWDGTAFRNLLRAGLAEIVAADLASNSVTAAKITDANVTLVKLDRVAGSPSDGQVLSFDNATGKLKFVTPGSFSFPTGLGGYVSTAAEIPSGWARDSNLDGRVPVGAGLLFSVTHTENTNYGSAWAFTPTGSVVIVIGTSNTSENVENGTNESVADDNHAHGITSQTFTGNSQAWDMPRRGVVWVKKS